jgi:hypothetical protein
MEDQTEIKTDTPVIDATGDTDIPVDDGEYDVAAAKESFGKLYANAGEPDPNVTPAGPAATSFADAVASFGGLDVKAPVEALPDEPAETVEEEADRTWKPGRLLDDGKILVYSDRGNDFVVTTTEGENLSAKDVAEFEIDFDMPIVIKSRETGLKLFEVDSEFNLVALEPADVPVPETDPDFAEIDVEAEVAKEDISASLEDDAIPVADDEDTPETETLQTAETTGHDFNALMFRTAALNAAASVCQGTGASSYEITAKAEDLMVWLQGDASSADFEEPRD